MIEFKTQLAGFYKLAKHQVDAAGVEIPGSREETGWFPNLITNTGLDLLASAGFMSSCFIGTGNSTPAFTNTALDNQAAFAGGSVASGPAGSDYTSGVGTYTFAQGAAVGNMQEVGVGNTSNALFSRALILDGAGEPTVLVLTSSDILTVYYQLREYPSQVDDVSVVADGATNYTVTTRSRNGLTNSRVASWNNAGIAGGDSGCELGNGSLGAWTGSPTGTNFGGPINNRTTPAYIPGTHYRDYTYNFATSEGNGTVNWAIMSNFGNGPELQASISPDIVKDNTRTLALTWRFSWGRYAP